jgi:phage terminase small subunit
VPDGLTLRQAKFAAEYLKQNGNQTRAAIAAGYAPSSAHVRGSQLVRNGKIKKHLEKLAKRHEITADRVLTRLDNLSLAAQEANNYAAAVKAEQLLGQYLGMFVDRSVNVNVSLNDSHIEAIRALASRRPELVGGSAGDNARIIDGQATTSEADNATFHNADYASDADKPVIDQRVSRKRALKQLCKPTSDVDGDNI